jgi:hypothetical protein
MKMIGLEQATLEVCIKDIQYERVVITRNGKPLALMVSVEGMDEEQLQLGSSDKFWKLVEKWRKEKTISRAELERRLNSKNGSRDRKQRKSSAPKHKPAI